MSNGVDPIAIEGFKEFRRGVKALNAEAPWQIKVGFNRAAEVVAQEARKRAPRKSGKLLESIRAASTTTAAQVRGGGKDVPYFGFIDYGGVLLPHGSRSRPTSGPGFGRRHNIERTFIPTGRILYPAYYTVRDEVLEILQDELTGVAVKNGIVVDRGRGL